jgi:hypothetical protein
MLDLRTLLLPAAGATAASLTDCDDLTDALLPTAGVGLPLDLEMDVLCMLLARASLVPAAASAAADEEPKELLRTAALRPEIGLLLGPPLGLLTALPLCSSAAWPLLQLLLLCCSSRGASGIAPRSQESLLHGSGSASCLQLS